MTKGIDSVQDFTQFIRPELMVLIPVLYVIGMGCKRSCRFKDCNIPISLGILGVILALLRVLPASGLSNWRDGLTAAFTAVTQGVLCAGCSVYIHQMIKQKRSREK